MMKCEKCGAEFEGNFCPNGCNTPQTIAPAKKKSIFKKWWFWVIIAVAITIIGAAAGGSNSAEPAPDSPAGTTQTETNKKPAEQPKQEDNIYEIGESFDADGLKITFLGAEKWTGYSQYFPPEDGYMYVRIKVSAENTATADRYFSSFEFEGYADGKKIDQHIETEGALAGGNISSGRSDEGYIYFTVPKDAKTLEVEYETSFWTDKKAVLKFEL